MLLRASTLAFVLAVVLVAAGFVDDTDARPMHAAIVSKYNNYLEEKETIILELNNWLDSYGTQGLKYGYIPSRDSRNSADELEDLLQRFYLTKEQISEARIANPMAEFSTDGPLTLMTMDEFKEFLLNKHVSDSKGNNGTSKKPIHSFEKENSTLSSGELKDYDPAPAHQHVKKKKILAPSQEHTKAKPIVRRLEDGGSVASAHSQGDHTSNSELEQFSKPTYQTNSAASANTDGYTRKGWNFKDLLTDENTYDVKAPNVDNGLSWKRQGVNNWARDYIQVSGNDEWGSGSHVGSQSISKDLQSDHRFIPAKRHSIASSTTENTHAPGANFPPTFKEEQTTSTQEALDAVVFASRTSAKERLVNKEPDSAIDIISKDIPGLTDSTTLSVTATKDSKSVDWSLSACVNPPGLQGDQCSSCWAFASLGALEAAQCIANGGKKMPSYSKQQLVSCEEKNYGCNGGDPVYALEHIRDNGICTESSYPYQSVKTTTTGACLKSCIPAKSGISEIVKLSPGNESALLNALEKQPVIVSVVSNCVAWKQYKSGIVSSCDVQAVDHTVLAVGFDSATIKIKNSWGTDWGEDGYVRISRNSKGMGTCGVLTDMSYPKL